MAEHPTRKKLAMLEAAREVVRAATERRSNAIEELKNARFIICEIIPPKLKNPYREIAICKVSWYGPW